ncbi:MAG: hypothetical protein ACK4TJ_10920 [Tabrizicola sp.]
MDSVSGGCLCGALRFTATVQPYRDRCFCPTCGSPVCAHIGDEIGINLGCLVFRPTYELWTIRREDRLPEFPWMRHCERNRETDSRTEG